MGIQEFAYYTLLKKGKILIAILALIVFIMVFVYIQNWMYGYEEITGNSLKLCETDNDCFNWCDECVSLASTKVCKSEYRDCECVNGLCQTPS